MGIEALRTEIAAIWANTTGRLTPEARAADVALALGAGRSRITAMLADEARDILNAGHGEVDRALGTLQRVSPEELTASERALGAALTAAASRPELLVNLYRARHLRPADRLLIDEAASGMIDALGGSDDWAFRDSWRSLQEELALGRSPEERDALGHRADLEELGGYLDNAEVVIGADLTLMDPSVPTADRDRIQVTRAIAEAEVSRYESLHAAPPDQDAVELVPALGRAR